MHKEYMDDVAKQLEMFKGLLSVLRSGQLTSNDTRADIARVERNIALNEAVLRIERDRILNAARP